MKALGVRDQRRLRRSAEEAGVNADPLIRSALVIASFLAEQADEASVSRGPGVVVRLGLTRSLEREPSGARARGRPKPQSPRPRARPAPDRVPRLTVRRDGPADGARPCPG